MTVDANAILDLWGQSEGLDPISRSVSLAAVVEPPVDHGTAFELPLGERNRRLLDLRRLLAGDSMESTVGCPVCGVVNEFSVDLEQLLALAPNDPSPISPEGRAISWRPINSGDLVAAAGTGSIEEAERALLDSCLVAIDNLPGTAVDLTDTERRALAEAIESADPLAEALFDITCLECVHGFIAEVDIAGAVWSEVSYRARSILIEVDTLARAYGWTESECLGLPTTRRSWYLNMATGGGW